MIVNQGFFAKRQQSDRLPPGQFETKDFPVLSLGPTPKVTTADWKLDVKGLCTPVTWSWQEFNALPMTELKTDIHCVTRWSKFDTTWKGVSLDEIIERVKVNPAATHLIAYSHDGYSTNLPLADVQNGEALVAVAYEGKEIPSEHGGPARLLVPHLYFWKSAKWLNALEFTNHDQPGFWETRGYHNYGDPWKEQRYSDD